MNALLGSRRRCRRLFGAAALAATYAAGLGPAAADRFTTVEPELGSVAALPGMPPAPRVAPSSPPAATAPLPPATPDETTPAATAPLPPPPAEAPPPNTAAAPAPPPGSTAASDGISVTRWGIGPHLGSVAGEITAGQPLYLWMTIAGGAAAVAHLATAGPIAIEVRWHRTAADDAAPGAPDLTTRLAIGQAALAPVLAAEVKRRGHFEWHSWARKDSLSPGAWTVSLTDPDGRPLTCGAAAHVCRFSVRID